MKSASNRKKGPEEAPLKQIGDAADSLRKAREAGRWAVATFWVDDSGLHADLATHQFPLAEMDMAVRHLQTQFARAKRESEPEINTEEADGA